MNDGGPAFPQTQFAEGMSLRDYFAAKAMVVFMQRHEVTAPDFLAEASYRFADAMINERHEI